MKDSEKTASRNVYLLGTTSFLNDVSSDMISPLIPLFVTSVGGGSAALGLIGGLRESISSILKVVSGYLSDRWGKRKILVLSGYSVSAIFKLLLPFSRSWYDVAAVISAERVGKGIRTAPRDAIIAESMPQRKGRGFGIHRAMDSLGAVVGSVIALFLLWKIKLDIRSVMFLAAILSFFSLIPLVFVREVKREGKNIPALHVSLKNMPSPLKWAITAISMFALANFSYMFFLMEAYGKVSVVNEAVTAVVFYIIFNAFYSTLSIPFGMLSDRVGRVRTIAIGYIFFSLTCLGFVFAHSMRDFIALFAIYGIVNAIVDGNQRALISDFAPAGLRATALGTFHTAMGLASLPSSMIAGFLWGIKSAEVVFLYGSVMSLIALMVLVVKVRD